MIKFIKIALALFIATFPANPALAENYCEGVFGFVNFRLAVPGIVHGPGFDIGDGPATFIKKTDGTFNVFGSNQVTWRAASPDMVSGYAGVGGSSGSNSITNPGTGDTIRSNLALAINAGQIGATPPGVSTDVCGDWITSTWQVGTTWFALVHNEGPCNYASSGYTNKSMAVYRSTDQGTTWAPASVSGVSPGTVASTLEGSIANTITGIGDCTWTPDAAGAYLYMYCGVYPTYRMAILRAPANNPVPGQWQVLYNGSFGTPGLNIPWTNNAPAADLIDWVGTNVARVPGLFPVLAVGQDHAYNFDSTETINGITLAASNDYVHFTQSNWPLLNWDVQNYPGPSNYDLYLYPVLRNQTDGSSVLAPNYATLWYTWVPPNSGTSDRFIVQQGVSIAPQSLSDVVSQVPEVAVTLETWSNPSNTAGTSAGGGAQQYRSTTVNPYASSTAAGVVENGWVTNSFLGYLPTKCPGSRTVNSCDTAGNQISLSIEECWNAANNDYALHINGNTTTPSAGQCPTGTVHQRTVGYMYRGYHPWAPNAIYSCSLTAGIGYHFASSDSACNGQTQLGLLGYALAS